MDSSETRLKGWSLWLGLAVLVSIAALGLAACGSDDSSDSTGGQTSVSETSSNGGGSAEELSGEPVKVMSMTPASGPLATFASVHVAAEAYGNYINQNGGVGGRPLEVVTCDTQGLPDKASACARQAVSEGVAAVVGSFDLNADAFLPVLEKGNVAWFGALSASSPSEFTSDISFPVGSGIGTVIGEGLKAGQTEGCDRIALISMDIPNKPFMIQAVNNALKSVNHPPLVKTVTVPVQPGGDLSAQVAEATTDTDCLVSAQAEANLATWLPAMEQAGAEQLFFGPQGNLNNKTVEPFPELTEGYIVSGAYPDLSASVWDDFRQSLDEIGAPDDLDYNSLAALGSWAGMVAFTKVAEGIKDVDSQAFIDAANKTNELVTGGLLPVLDFTKEFPLEGFEREFVHGATYQEVQNGEIVSLDDRFTDLTNAFMGKPGPVRYLPTE